MSNDKKILNENTVRRFMTLANLNPLSNTFITERLDDDELDDEPELGGDEPGPRDDELDFGGDELDLGDEAPGVDWDVEQVTKLTVAITDAIEGVTGVETSVSGIGAGEGDLEPGGEGDLEPGGEGDLEFRDEDEDEDLGLGLEEKVDPKYNLDFEEMGIQPPETMLKTGRANIAADKAAKAETEKPRAKAEGGKGFGGVKFRDIPKPAVKRAVARHKGREAGDDVAKIPTETTPAKESIQREALRRYQIHGTRLQETHRRQLDQRTANNLYARCYNQVLQEYRMHQSRQLLINEVHKSVIAQLRMLTENNRQFTAKDIEYIIRKTLNEVTKKSQKDSLVEAVMQRVASRLTYR